MTTLIPKYEYPSSSINRPINEKLKERISVLDFGADPTGATDSTDAIALALSTCLNIGVQGGGLELYFPKGTYLCHIAINGQNQNDSGQDSLSLCGYGATLIGRASDTSIIQVNGAVANVADPNPGGAIYANGLVIEGFTLDMVNMANSAAIYAIAVQHSYACALRDVGTMHEPSLGGSLFLGSQTYTWTVENFKSYRISVKGYDASANLSSVHNFYNIDTRQVVLQNVFSIGFYGGNVQGSLDHFNFVDSVQAIVVTGMDLEGPNTGEYVYNVGTNVRYVTSFGNTCGGYTFDSYSNGLMYNSFLEDRPNLYPAINNIGVYGKTSSQGKVSVTTTPKGIYYFKDTQAGQNFGLFLISADNGLNGFQDLIMVGLGVVTVIKAQDLYGTTPTRTYTNSSDTLFASVSSGTYSFRPVVMEFLMSTV